MRRGYRMGLCSRYFVPLVGRTGQVLALLPGRERPRRPGREALRAPRSPRNGSAPWHVDELARLSGVLHDSAVLRKRLVEAGDPSSAACRRRHVAGCGRGGAGTAARRELDRRGRHAVRATARAQLGRRPVGSALRAALICAEFNQVPDRAAARDGTADTRADGVLLPGEGAARRYLSGPALALAAATSTTTTRSAAARTC